MKSSVIYKIPLFLAIAIFAVQTGASPVSVSPASGSQNQMLDIKSASSRHASSRKIVKRSTSPGYRRCYRQPQGGNVGPEAVHQASSPTNDKSGTTDHYGTREAPPASYTPPQGEAQPLPEHNSSYNANSYQDVQKANSSAPTTYSGPQDLSSYAHQLKLKPIDWTTYSDLPTHPINECAKQPPGWSITSEANVAYQFKRSNYSSTQWRNYQGQMVTVTPLSVNKRMYNQALMKYGASLPEVKMVHAIINKETTHGDNAQRDHAKSGDLSENVSALNVNIDCLITGGVDIDYQKNGQFHPLATLMNTNSQEGVDATVEAFLKAYRYFGSYEFLNFHRGGQAGWKDGHSYDTTSYRVGIASLIRILPDDVTDPIYSNDERFE